MRYYILIGQSNAAGTALATGLPAELQTVQSDSWILEGTVRTEFELLEAGVNTRVAGTAKFGPEVTCSRDLIAGFGEPVACIKYGVGGSGLCPEATGAGGANWSPGQERLLDHPDTNFMHMVWKNAMDDARRRGWVMKPEAVVWVQGEEDAETGNPCVANYQANELALVNRVRWLVNEPGLLFVSARLASWSNKTDATTINAAKDANVSAITRYVTVNTDALTESGDFVHYDAAGYQGLGESIAAAIIANQ